MQNNSNLDIEGSQFHLIHLRKETFMWQINNPEQFPVTKLHWIRGIKT